MSKPWMPAAYEDADVAAIRALSHGEATPAQQVHALQYIVETLAGYYDISFRPEPDGGALGMAFHEGRRFVGAQLVKLTKLTRKHSAGRTDRDPDKRAGS